ncbi:MAG: hypothetical protein RIB45_10390 [Marivibrio sp.]|uniref:DUF7033 domain-containing protein n=1 Tax=Marivibrio sp. TaxID=2039719 RepID=UPI0032EFCE01
MTDLLRYRLVLPEAAEPYRREIEFALDFVAEAYPIQRDANAERRLFYGKDMPARFFPDALRIEREGLYLDQAGFCKLTDFWPKAERGAFDYDAIGVIFFMLSRIEERDAKMKDRHGRFEPSGAAAVNAGLHDRAVADEAAADIAAWLLGRRTAPQRSFEILPTHDVDRLKRYHVWTEPLRHAAGDVLKRGAPRSALRWLSFLKPGEPFGSMRAIMNASERFGLKSRFFMMGPSRHTMDSPYVLTMAGLLRRVGAEILARGHEIGFHPGYATFDDPDEWRRQKKGLEEVLGVELRSGRQHVLRYRPDVTPRIWDEAGMEEDFTLAFPGPSGFRNGTTASHRAYDLVHRRPMTMRQTATAVMDFGLFDARYRVLTLDQALDEALSVAETVKRHRGRLVLLHHTGSFMRDAQEFYERLLEAVL